jgi:hypothetical protein
MLAAAAVVLVLVGAGVGVAQLSNRSTGTSHPPRPIGSGPVISTTAPAAGTSTTPPSSTVAPTTTIAGIALQSVDWPNVAYPIACGSTFHPAVTVQQVAYPTPAAGVQLAAVLARCNSGAGTPSSAVFVYDRATTTTTPHLAATLVAATDGWQTAGFTAAGASLSLPVNGFSSTSVANCCPDVHTTLTWNWLGAGYVPTGTPPFHITYPQ